MELFTYDVKSKNKLFLGRQYDHKSAVISFSGFKVDDPNDFIYLKLGEPVGKKYLLGDDLSVTITSEMTAKPAVMRGQLIEYRTTAEAEDEASYIKSSPVFYCQVAQSIRAEGTPDATDPTIDSAYAKIQGYEESAKASAKTAEQAAEDASKATIDIKNKVDKVETATVGHMAIFTDGGNIADGGLPKGTEYIAGDNVQIDGAVISATDTTYTAGNNISISDNVISAKDTTYVAGDNVTISGNIISATDTIYDDSAVRSLIGTKVTKEDGKVLSSNDYTSSDKAKVDAIPSNPKYTDTTYTAGTNVTISGNTISAKDTTYTAGDNVTITGNIISAKDTTYTAGANITIKDGVISASGGGSGTSYVAGDNISISGNVISATDTTYTAGDNVTITDNVISAKGIAYTAGTNITISGNVISAKDTTYTAGDNVTIKNGTISAKDTTYTAGDGVTISNGVISSAYTAGDNVTITDNVISATDTTYTAGDNVSITNGTISAKDTIYDDSAVRSLINAKVDKEDGKTLSSNDYTASAKAKVDAIPSDPKYTDTTYTAGTNVTITDNVISAKDTTYTAGDNVAISNGVISATDTTYTAGDNITIKDGVISSSNTSYVAGDNISISGNVISATDTTYTAGADKYSGDYDIIIDGNVIYFNSMEIYDSITNLRQDAGDWAEENATKIASNTTAINNLKSASHTHTNMSALKQITADSLTNWNTAYTNSHTHANKDALDSIASTDVTNWNTAYTNNHTHTNKDVLDTITADSVHTHTNKDALDTITSEKIGFWNTAYTNNHTHSNKSVLDGITSTHVSNWNTAYVNARYLTNSSVLKNITSTNVTSWNNKADKADIPVADTDYVTPATLASTYATLNEAFLARTDTVTDANDVPYGFGMYTVESTCSNIPTAQQYWLFSFLNANGNGIQFARRTTKASGNYNQFYVRIKISSGWDSWVYFETV